MIISLDKLSIVACMIKFSDTTYWWNFLKIGQQIFQRMNTLNLVKFMTQVWKITVRTNTLEANITRATVKLFFLKSLLIHWCLTIHWLLAIRWLLLSIDWLRGLVHHSLVCWIHHGWVLDNICLNDFSFSSGLHDAADNTNNADKDDNNWNDNNDN